MKRVLWLTVIFFFLLPQGAVLGADISQPESISIPNAGFELNPTDPYNGWIWSGGNWTWDGTAHSGAHSARIYRNGGDETSSLWSGYIPIQASSIYTFSFWLRSESASKNPSVVIYQYTNGEAQTGPRQMVYSNVGSGTNGWFQVNYRFQTLPNTAKIKIRLYLYTDTTGTFWFDDFMLDQGNLALFPFSSGFPVVSSGWVYMSSPSVADINNDGSNELLIGADDAVNGWTRTGNILPGYPLPTSDRYIYNHLAVGDLDGDDRMEIVAGTRTANPPEGQCRVYAWQDDGSLLSGWPIAVDWNPYYSNNDCKITSVVMADVDGNQQLEILASTTNNASGNPNAGIYPVNLYAWRVNGTLVNGLWPSKLTAAGFYGAIAAGDINDDGRADVITARDHHRLNAYNGYGYTLNGWPIETYLNGNEGDYQTDQRIVFGRSAPVLADLDGNRTSEFIVIGNVTGPGNITEAQNTALLVLNSDGTRMSGWEMPALGTGILTQEDLPQKSPAIGDINADGLPEIIATTTDGWIRAYDLQKNVLWEFNYTQGATLFATEPVIGDVDGDIALEVVFGTHVPVAGTDWDGPVGLWSLEANGTVTSGFPLPIPTPGMDAAPTLADLDGDGNLDILAATITGQVFSWDTSNPTYPARLPWPTARHDLMRTGTYSDPNSFGNSHIFGSPNTVQQGDVATFNIHVSSLTPIFDTVTLVDTIPSGISYIPGTLFASAGTVTERHGVIQWSGSLSESLSVDISYQVTVNTRSPKFIVNTVTIDTTIEGLVYRKGYLYANTEAVYLPVLQP
ncbi:MAG: hypothetical protein C3F13_12955 [Anaerolineales bacterium]|nr:VCBS repeat-containing protein [Anaerolineae bacterium]PWB51813.1 MAG: hypothetical protein C3F13_12955 [Anaerolineales bacterium]